MTTIDLKKALVQRIIEINDVSFLKAIKTILDSKSGKENITLTEAQKQEISASRVEIEKGLYIDQEILDNEFVAWANEE
jgi:hypothetical protein